MRENTSRHLYLMTVYNLSKDGARVRNVDIAKVLGYSKPSITSAVRKLYSEGLILIDKSKGILLTDLGLSIAQKLSRRNAVLTAFFKNLGLSENAAAENAGRIGHLITDELYVIIEENTSVSDMVK